MEKAAEPKIPQEFILDAFADPTSVRDVVRGIDMPFPSPSMSFKALSTKNPSPELSHACARPWGYDHSC
jgi:hypothetical protein